jgi:hypothetical protein
MFYVCSYSTLPIPYPHHTSLNEITSEENKFHLLGGKSSYGINRLSFYLVFMAAKQQAFSLNI